MINLLPIPKALIPRNSAIAGKVSSKNYDEFQSADEIINIIKNNPKSILKVKMPHCILFDGKPVGPEGSAESYALSARFFKDEYLASPDMEVAEHILAVYQIINPENPKINQMGIIGYAKVSDIRTPLTPAGSIIRNEGVQEKKVTGRAQIIKHTGAYIGVVNNVVDDKEDKLQAALNSYINSKECTYFSKDEAGYQHKIWIVRDKAAQEKFIAILNAEPQAYVADGNHRSAAAARLKFDSFLCVFFPIKSVNIMQYNRLVNCPLPADFMQRLMVNFDIETWNNKTGYQPENVHNIGLYFNKTWIKLVPKEILYKNKDAVNQIDAEIVQKQIITGIFKIENTSDERLNYVGGDRSLEYLSGRVDSGEFKCALTLPPVTPQQFVDVCLQNLLMPPKSTWFYPKVRSGLVIGLL